MSCEREVVVLVFGGLYLADRVDLAYLLTSVDGLKSAHTSLFKVAKVFDTETYDYPVSTARMSLPSCAIA